MTRPDFRFLPAAAQGPTGGGTLTGRAVRPARPVLSDLSGSPLRDQCGAQVIGQGAQGVWMIKPAAMGKSEMPVTLITPLFGQMVQMGGHPVTQVPARGQHVAFPSILRPGHCRPHPFIHVSSMPGDVHG